MIARAENSEFARKWIAQHCKAEASEFGVRAFVLLALWCRGAHHIPNATKIDWTREDEIVIRPYERPAGLSTYDADDLSVLVFLAHDEALRVAITPQLEDAGGALYGDDDSPKPEGDVAGFTAVLVVRITPRHRDGSIFESHPKLEDQVRKHRARFCTPLESEVAA
ncbi:MAG: hypothetical protein ABMA13_18205 [Chthoniobacteraceae bacterium]